MATKGSNNEINTQKITIMNFEDILKEIKKGNKIFLRLSWINNITYPNLILQNCTQYLYIKEDNFNALGFVMIKYKYDTICSKFTESEYRLSTEEIFSNDWIDISEWNIYEKISDFKKKNSFL